MTSGCNHVGSNHAGSNHTVLIMRVLIIRVLPKKWGGMRMGRENGSIRRDKCPLFYPKRRNVRRWGEKNDVFGINSLPGRSVRFKLGRVS